VSGRKSGVVVGHCKYIYYMQDKPAKQKCREKVEKRPLGEGDMYEHICLTNLWFE
jgi:hypothetical protein